MPDPDGRSPMNRPSTVHNLAEATTFADDDLSLRRRNAFGTAVRHSRRVNFLRKALPIAGGTGLLFIILWTWLDPLRFASGLPIELGRISISGTKLKMDAPKLKGFSRDGRPYTVTAEEAAQSEKRHLLSRSLGGDLFVNVEIDDHQVHAGDVLLLCSDGLYGAVTPEDIGNLAAFNPDPAVAVAKLVELAKERDGGDNITVQLIRIRDVERMGMYRGRPYKLR